MHKLSLTKPDGRPLFLYSREPIDPAIRATSPSRTPLSQTPHLRWHPLRAEWVAYASYRQDRAFLPPAEFNPLAVTKSEEFPTELPPGKYDVAVFENLSPALTRRAEISPPLVTPTMPAQGACEVIVFSQDPTTSLGRLPLWHLELVLDVWADRYEELGRRDDVQYVMPFENKGVEVGVTLHHPHGQLYAYPFVPPNPAKALEEQKKFFEREKRGLLETHLEKELAEDSRLIHRGESSVALIPAFARYPYEVWIAPLRTTPSLSALSVEERRDFARTLKTVLLKLDGLWQRPFPYLMVLHQAPTDGLPHPESHFHIEFYPPYRTRDRLKYLAGTELGAGMFANDSLPEEKALELRRIEVTLD